MSIELLKRLGAEVGPSESAREGKNILKKCLQGQRGGGFLFKTKKVTKKYLTFVIFTFKVPRMFPGLLEKFLESLNFQTLTAIVR